MEDEERQKRFERCRDRFKNEVRPTELLPYLNCLTSSMKEQVERWEDREGPENAAYKLSLQLVKKDHWYEDLIYALRETNHDSLADEICGTIPKEATAEDTSVVTSWCTPENINSKPGDVIEFNRGLYQHFGITDGTGRVYHFDPKTSYLRLDKIKDVADGSQVRINNAADRRMNPLPQQDIMKRARTATEDGTGRGRYNMLTNNCEHFANFLRYGEGDDIADWTPAEILARGQKAVAAYKEAIKSGKKAVYRTRLMFVGQLGVGKTSLKKRLTGERFDINEKSTDSIDTSLCRIDRQHAKDWKVVPAYGVTFKQAVAGEMKKTLKPEMTKNVTKQDENMEDESDTRSSTSAKEYTEEFAVEVEMQLQNDDVKLDEPKEITYSLWDFAGQELYYTTHQVFLSRRAIFVLVFNLMEGKDHDKTFLDKIDFWMKSIYSLLVVGDKQREDSDGEQDQSSPPIFIVGTHRDALQDAKQQEDIFKTVDNLLKDKDKRYRKHFVNPKFAVENALHVDEQLTKLREKITQVAEQEEYMKEEKAEIPLRWLQFEEEVKGKVSKEVNDIPIEEVKKLEGARAIPDTAPDELRTMLEFYHDLGVIIYFPDARPPLSDCVILNPPWLIDVFKSVITVVDKKQEMGGKYVPAWERLETEGVLEDELITYMWKEFLKSEDAVANKKKKEALVTLMEKYYLLVRKNSSNQKNTCYYVPARLQIDPLKVCDLTDIPDEHTVFFIDFHGFLTDGIFFQLLARAVHWSQEQVDVSDEVNLQDGTFPADSNHEFKLQRNGNMIKVSVNRDDVVGGTKSSPTNVNGEAAMKVKKFLVRSLVDLKKTWLPGIKYQFCVACPCGIRDQHYLDLDKCLTGCDIIKCEKKKRISKELIRKKFATQCQEESEDQVLSFQAALLQLKKDCVKETEDISDIREHLGPDQLQNFFHALGIPDDEIKKTESAANTNHPDLKAHAVLNYWIQTNSPNATKYAIIVALKKCKFKDKATKLIKKWCQFILSSDDWNDLTDA